MKTIEIVKFNTPPSVLKSISKDRGIPMPTVKAMCRYNVFTVNQLAQLSGLTVNDINNKCKPGLRKPAELLQCGVFPEFKDGKEVMGKVFVVRNEDCENLL